MHLLPRSAPEPTASLSVAQEKQSKAFGSAEKRLEFVRSRKLVQQLFQWELTNQASGAPLWPRNFVGSLTHKQGHIAVSVEKKFASIGLDIEAPVGNHLEPRICTDGDTFKGSKSPEELALTFAAKEALFKCHFPLGGKMFHFHDAIIKELHGDSFIAEVLLDTSAQTPKGHQTSGAFRWLEMDGKKMVLAVCTVDRP